MKIYTVQTKDGKTGKTIAKDIKVGDWGSIQFDNENGDTVVKFCEVAVILDQKELWG